MAHITYGIPLYVFLVLSYPLLALNWLNHFKAKQSILKTHSDFMIFLSGDLKCNALSKVVPKQKLIMFARLFVFLWLFSSDTTPRCNLSYWFIILTRIYSSVMLHFLLNMELLYIHARMEPSLIVFKFNLALFYCWQYYKYPFYFPPPHHLFFSYLFHVHVLLHLTS